VRRTRRTLDTCDRRIPLERSDHTRDEHVADPRAFTRRDADYRSAAQYLHHPGEAAPFSESCNTLRSLMTHQKLLIYVFAALSLVATPLLASAAVRLSDQEVKALLDEHREQAVGL
jgi:hypothetical protein